MAGLRSGRLRCRARPGDHPVRRHPVALVALAGVLLAACAAPAVHPAVTRVADLLELRRDDVRDPAAYEGLFADPQLAAALTEGSEEPTGTPQIPDYDPPYLTAETTSTADVAVVWKASEDFSDWPAVTVFIVSFADGRWVVVDALESTVAPEPLDATPAR